jgi:hypothetical protein
MTDAWPSKKEYEAALRNINLRLESLAARAGSTMAKARAYGTADQSGIPANVITKVNLNAESYDPGSNFDIVNYKFVAPVAGYYSVAYAIQWGSTLVGGVYVAHCYVNGAEVSANVLHAYLANNLSPLGADIIYLAVNDYVELYGSHWVVAGNSTISANSAKTWLAIHLLSGV